MAVCLERVRCRLPLPGKALAFLHNWMAVPMRASSLSFLAGIALVALSAPLAADVKGGVDAWTRGDYAAAVRAWQGPAAQGDADALFNLGQAAGQ